jgi:hypothetical protein
MRKTTLIVKSLTSYTARNPYERTKGKIKKERELKDPTDYRPASNSYPSQNIRRDIADDALGPSDSTLQLISKVVPGEREGGPNSRKSIN